ncbi:tfc4p like TFIIIC subunit TPR repeat containing basal transcription factor [Cryptosporidium sp. chipmunk genotype I]|uniref:tfc4p like TFIIIC subunit TPR repeat containing basal transcription factor n=1 Tax=Cryptosporidium sp. chipmunk genotype I TaxID=1280935 RepID=UPI00351A95DB|nr:tfc4p like TFIIIC subunit TPR repeat containing basal transcription factor [Cryptosporidium sp. chipmunk genotype I]
MNTIHPTTSSLSNEIGDDETNISEFPYMGELLKFGDSELKNDQSSNLLNQFFDNCTEDESDSENMLSFEFSTSNYTNVRKRKRDSTVRKKIKSQQNVTIEIEKLLQKANDAYLEKKFILAIEILEEVVVKAPGLHDPFHMLGLIYEQELDDKEKAIGFYLVAAHLVGTDFFLWKRIGQMCAEIQDWSRAIYCYSKCIKNLEYSEKLGGKESVAQLEDEIRFELSSAYYSVNDINRCIQQLKILFWRHPGDPLLGKELARCYHKIGKLNLAAETLESCVDYCDDVNIVNMLCEVYIDLKLYQKCVDLIHNYFEKLNIKLNYFNSKPNKVAQNINNEVIDNQLLKKVPIDIATKYAVANLNFGNYTPALQVSKIINEYKNFEDFIDLHLTLGDAYFQVGKYDNANIHFVAVSNSKSFESNLPFNIKYAYSLHKLNLNEDAVSLLKKLLEKNKGVSGDFNISRAKALLASIYSKMGYDNLSEELIYTMKYDEIIQSKDISIPIPQEMRITIVLDLFSDMKKGILEAVDSFDIQPYLETAITVNMHFEPNNTSFQIFADRFSNVINEFLTDIKRINQLIYSRKYNENNKKITSECIEKDVSGTTNHSKNPNDTSAINTSKRLQRANIQLAKVRSELGLITLEDILASENEFWHFLSLGAIFLKCSKKNKIAVELFEKLLNNLKLICPEMNGDSLTKGKHSLQKLLLTLSFEGGIWRVLLGLLREEFNKNSNKKSICKVIGSLILMPNLFVSKLNTLNNHFILEKETIGETRSWIQRQISNSRDNLELRIITAHLYVLSNRLNQALSEYLKIHRLIPFDDLISLCLGVSLIGVAISKESKNRIFSIIKGFSFIMRYSKGRQSIYVNNEVYKAECFYNLARAFHQINLKSNAIRCYIKCINFLNSITDVRSYDSKKLKKMACYNLSLLSKADIFGGIIW